MDAKVIFFVKDDKYKCHNKKNYVIINKNRSEFMNKKIASFLLTLLLTCCMLLPANTYADNTDLTIVGKQYQLPSNIKVNESNIRESLYYN